MSFVKKSVKFLILAFVLLTVLAMFAAQQQDIENLKSLTGLSQLEQEQQNRVENDPLFVNTTVNNR